MDELNLVPIYRNGLGEITPGIDIPVPKFCKGRCGLDKNCLSHYKKMESAEPGIYECPFGFSSCVFKIDDDNFIFTCLKISGGYNKKKLNPKIKEEPKSYREISEIQLEKYIEAYMSFYDNQRQYDVYRSFIEDIFHDIRKFNRDIKYKNERIYKKSQQNSKKFGQFSDISKSIQAMCWFMSIRLNNHDFIYNEELMDKDIKSTYNIHKIIYKVKECMNDRAKDKDVKIRICANQEIRDIKAYECLELLPYLLLDNAIKYSLSETEIIIKITERKNMQYVHLESIGPLADKEEQQTFFSQNVRGKYAETLAPGMGIGLYTAKCICELNGIEIKIESDDNIVKTRNNVPYSKFNVDFWIQI